MSTRRDTISACYLKMQYSLIYFWSWRSNNDLADFRIECWIAQKEFNFKEYVIEQNFYDFKVLLLFY